MFIAIVAIICTVLPLRISAFWSVNGIGILTKAHVIAISQVYQLVLSLVDIVREMLTQGCRLCEANFALDSTSCYCVSIL